MANYPNAIAPNRGLTGVRSAMTLRAKSRIFDLDNGAGTTVDDVLFVPTAACTLKSAKIVYVGATTGTVAAGNIRLGTAVGGSQIVASTAYENTKAVGTTTAATLVATSLAAGQALHCRHTGVAATQAGEAFVEVEYVLA